MWDKKVGGHKCDEVPVEHLHTSQPSKLQLISPCFFFLSSLASSSTVTVASWVSCCREIFWQESPALRGTSRPEELLLSLSLLSPQHGESAEGRKREENKLSDTGWGEWSYRTRLTGLLICFCFAFRCLTIESVAVSTRAHRKGNRNACRPKVLFWASGFSGFASTTWKVKSHFQE